MGFVGYRHTDEDVLRWARMYTGKKRVTLMDMEAELNVHHSTIWWCFQHRLSSLDTALYALALERLDYNMRNKVYKGGKKNG